MGMNSNNVKRRAEALIAYTMRFYKQERNDPSSLLHKLTKIECRETIKQAQQENPDWPEYEDDSIEREQLRWMIEANRKGKPITLQQALDECTSPYPVHI